MFLPIDNITIICCVVLLVLTAAACICSTFFLGRKLRRQIAEAAEDAEAAEYAETAENADDVKLGDEKTTAQALHDKREATCPPVSVVIPIHEECPQLENRIERLLAQDYPAPFRIILVADKGNTQVEELSAIHSQNKKLYCTFVPTSSRYMSRKKLAITLGVKAAETDWVVIMDAACKPLSNRWLRALAEHFDTHPNLVVQGCARFSDDAKAYRRFEQTMLTYEVLSHASRRHPYRDACRHVALRKSCFMQGDGFSGMLSMLHGEYDFLVNKFGRDGYELALRPEARVEIDAPCLKEWQGWHLYFWETRKHLVGGGAFRMRRIIDNALLRIVPFCSAAALAFAIITQRYALLATAVVALFFAPAFRTWQAKKSFRALGESVSAWQVVPFELSFGCRQLISWFRYLRANKNEFTSHKI